MSNSQIYTSSSHGWLVMLDLHPKSSKCCFLLNPVSMEKIKLPPLPKPLISDVGFSPKYHCILTAPPGDPKCVVVFFQSFGEHAMWCRLGGTKEPQWREQEFDRPRPFTYSVLCGTKIYCLDRKHKKLMEMSFDEDGRMEARPLSLPGKKRIGKVPYPYPLLVRNMWFGTHYLVESQSHLYLVILFHGMEDENKIIDIWVFKLDFQSLKWTRVNDLGGHRVFFISSVNSFSCSTVNNGGSSSSSSPSSAIAIATTNANGDECVKENTIYIILPSEVGMTALCVYDMEEKTITTRLVCPNVIPNITRGYWVMPMAS
ncbi:unnamed protein product [Cuscuta campestris]|uniref:KIB1-4 beta-propeller domain-containing protein n=1 Tax=Cuscuta campestris TaxID=132261 RepID=A0A484MEY8_9ASTE|nr:unnamed protein product [Cuscuta campestris]